MKKLSPDMILGFISVLILLFSMTLEMKLYFWDQEMYQSSILNFFISGILLEGAAIMLFTAWAIKPRKQIIWRGYNIFLRSSSPTFFSAYKPSVHPCWNREKNIDNYTNYPSALFRMIGKTSFINHINEGTRKVFR